eukprot:1366730-Pyramimonas_sp.AAC.1
MDANEREWARMDASAARNPPATRRDATGAVVCSVKDVMKTRPTKLDRLGVVCTHLACLLYTSDAADDTPC